MYPVYNKEIECTVRQSRVTSIIIFYQFLVVRKASKKYTAFKMSTVAWVIIQHTLRIFAHLYSRFSEADPHCNFFSHEDIWIVRFRETPLELVELGGCKPRPVSFLFGGLVAITGAAPYRVTKRRKVAVAEAAQPRLFQHLQLALVPFEIFPAHFFYP